MRDRSPASVSGDPVAIASYLGTADAFDNVLANFSAIYADQHACDRAALQEAVDTGRTSAQTDYKHCSTSELRCLVRSTSKVGRVPGTHAWTWLDFRRRSPASVGL